MTTAFNFYTGILRTLLAEGILGTDDKILVVAAGEFDKQVHEAVGFTDVVISNMDTRMTENSFAPFAFAFEDAESLTFVDNSFDFAVVHSGLHHCRVPHQALAEMYRVARKGVLFIESRDNLVLRTAARAGLIPDYEIEAVVGNNNAFGGVRNTATPNYVYRWTEREVEKIARSVDPTGPLAFRYFYALRLPDERIAMHRSAAVRTAYALLTGPVRLAARIFKRQGNLFAAFIGRPPRPWPWNGPDGLIDQEWAGKRYVARPGDRQR